MKPEIRRIFNPQTEPLMSRMEKEVVQGGQSATMEEYAFYNLKGEDIQKFLQEYVSHFGWEVAWSTLASVASEVVQDATQNEYLLWLNGIDTLLAQGTQHHA